VRFESDVGKHFGKAKRYSLGIVESMYFDNIESGILGAYGWGTGAIAQDG